MGMGRKKDRERQKDLCVAFNEIVTTPGHVFYEQLNTARCARMYISCRGGSPA